MKTSKKRNGGFTLPEMLITVAILVIVLAFGIVGVARYRDYLKITELDNIAREIYMAAENRAVLLQNSGAARSQVSSLTKVEVEGTEYPTLAHPSAAAVSSSDELLPAGSIDPALREGHFFVLYDEATSHVTEVFYAEKEEIKEGWLGTLRKSRSDRVDAFRSDAADTPTCLVGHYQGDATGMADSDVKILPAPGVEVLIENGNELTLTVKYTLPGNMPKKADGTSLPVDRTPVVRLKYQDAEIELLNKTNSGNYFNRKVSSLSFGDIVNDNSASYTWVLDSLVTDESGNFNKQFKGLFTNDSLVLGRDFTVTAGLTLTADGYIDSAYYAEGSDNSLFAKGSATASADLSVPDRTDTALIANLRHLQNLSGEPSTYAYMSTGGAENTASSFTSNVVISNAGSYSSYIEKAEQMADIECRDYKSNDGSYWNPNYNFSAINNPSLVSYDGKGYELRNLYSDNHGGGLFNQTGEAGMTFQHIRLIAPEIRVSHKGGVDPAGLVMMLTGRDNTLNDVWAVNAVIYGEGGTNPAAGGLVGIIGGQDRDTSVTINNCRVFWQDEKNDDGTVTPVSQLLTEGGQIDYKITSKFAGGLVGICASNFNHTYELKITNSFAATTIKSCHPRASEVYNSPGKNACIGGLVGGTGYHDSTEGTVRVNIENSYADCYFGEDWKEDTTVAGKTVTYPVYIGGLVGSHNSYAGSSGTQNKASLTIKNSYAAGFIVNPRDHVKSAGLANDQKPGKITAQNCYSVVRVLKTDGTLKEPATPMYSGWNKSSPGSALYLSTADVDDVKATLGTAFEYEADKTETHVYDLRYEMSKTPGPAKEALKLTSPYPFPGLKDVTETVTKTDGTTETVTITFPHYDDWAELENKAAVLELVYYEEYAEETGKEKYGFQFSGQFTKANKDCKTPEGVDTPESKVLKKFPLTMPEDRVVRTIKEDGYALAVKADELASLKTQKTTIVWSSTTENSASYKWTLSWIEDQGKGKWQWERDVSSEEGVSSTAKETAEFIEVHDPEYTLIHLPVEMVYGDRVPRSNPSELRYYQKLAVTTETNAERTFYFNPHLFIEIQGPRADGAAPEKPNYVGATTIMIRTPRHFYDLSRDYVAGNGEGWPYAQADVGGDYMRTFKQVFDLDYATYNPELLGKGRSQDPIKSNTNFTYDGQCHRIQNVFVKDTGRSVGLFSVLNKNSKLENIVFEMDPNPMNPQTVGEGNMVDEVGALLGRCDDGKVENCAVYGVNIKATAPFIGGLVGRLNASGSVQKCSAEVVCLEGSGNIGGLVGVVQSSTASVTDSYAVGYINKTSGEGFVGGLVGSVTYKDTVIKNCYAAVHLESKGSKYGLCNKGTVINGYWLKGTFRYRGEVYTVGDSTYLVGGKDEYQSTPITPDQLAAQLATKLPTFTQSADTMTVKNIADESYAADYTGNFPYFTIVEGVGRNPDGTVIDYSNTSRQPIHYGLWPVAAPEISLFYYEKYGPDAYGFYRAIREKDKAAVIESTLQDDQTILKDGYALAVKEKDLPWFISNSTPKSKVSVQYGNIVETFSNDGSGFKWDGMSGEEGSFRESFEVAGTKYVMLPLWNSVHTDSRANTSSYSQTLTVKLEWPVGQPGYERRFFFNPHFAKALSCPAEGSISPSETGGPTVKLGQSLDDNKTVPVYVRTARHFNALSRYQYKDANDKLMDAYVKSYYFLQECDVDYKTYEGYGLFSLKEGQEVYEQPVIGRGEKSDVNAYFTGTYDGGGHRLKNVVFDGKGIDKRGLGLFGIIGENGCLKNIIYEPGGTATVNCHISAVEGKVTSLYAGGLAGSNTNGTVDNCAVLGFKVKIVGELPHTVSIDNFYVGSLVAMNQGGTISNCFAEVQNLTVPTAADANATSFAVGALVGGSYGDNVDKPARVENCYAVGTITGGDEAKIAGLVGQSGHSGNGSCVIRNSYSAVALQGEAKKYNICSPHNDNYKGTVEKCYYLSDTWSYGGDTYNTTAILLDTGVAGYSITGKTYDQLAALTETDLPGMSKLAGTGVYPFPVSTTDKDGNWYYFGTDWPRSATASGIALLELEEYPETSMFYYEKYTPENNKEDYGFYRAIRGEGKDPVVIGTLDESRIREKGGYALAVSLDDLARMDEFTEVKVICIRNAETPEAADTAERFEGTFKREGESLIWNTQGESGESDQAFACSIEGTDYILLPLPESWQKVDSEGGKDIIVTLEVIPVKGGAGAEACTEAEAYMEAEVHTEAESWTEVEAGKRTFYFNPYSYKMLSCPEKGSTQTPQMPTALPEEEKNPDQSGAVSGGENPEESGETGTAPSEPAGEPDESKPGTTESQQDGTGTPASEPGEETGALPSEQGEEPGEAEHDASEERPAEAEPVSAWMQPDELKPGSAGTDGSGEPTAP